jgi:hypothetical protein
MRIISRDVSIAIISTLIGVAVGSIIGYIGGYRISNHFYQISKQESKKDLKEQLINSALVDLAHNTFKRNYPQLFDSIQFASDAGPWRKLATTGIDRLYFDILAFKDRDEDWDKVIDLMNIVNTAKLATDDFNDRMTLRNLSVLLGPVFKAPYLATVQNPSAYQYYHQHVLPALLNLQEYIKKHRKDLVH